MKHKIIKEKKMLNLLFAFLFGVFVGAFGLVIYLKSIPVPTPKIDPPKYPPSFFNSVPFRMPKIATEEAK